MDQITDAKKNDKSAAGIADDIILRARGLSKTYGSGDSLVQALDQVDLDVRRGELIAVLGNSGSGKSTLLNMLGGMDRFDSGSIMAGDRELAEMSDTELTDYRRHTIGFVFQSFNLISELTARENVALTTSGKNRQIPDKALELVGLSDKTDRYPAQLSGGQQQRVSIARALAKNPDIFLCDEPTGALDSETGSSVLRCLEELVREYGKTMIIVTHNQEIAKIADRTIIMKNGKIISDQKNERICSVEELDW